MISTLGFFSKDFRNSSANALRGLTKMIFLSNSWKRLAKSRVLPQPGGAKKRTKQSFCKRVLKVSTKSNIQAGL
jgi:hypothetical protein